MSFKAEMEPSQNPAGPMIIRKESSSSRGPNLRRLALRRSAGFVNSISDLIGL
jgi:hypothetical protein